MADITVIVERPNIPLHKGALRDLLQGLAVAPNERARREALVRVAAWAALAAEQCEKRLAGYGDQS